MTTLPQMNTIIGCFPKPDISKWERDGVTYFRPVLFSGMKQRSRSRFEMRMLTGAILILTAEQAFAHAHLVGFPNHLFVNEVLVPTSLALAILGAGFLIWGIVSERKPTGIS